MAVPASQAWAVARHVFKNRWRGSRRFPVVLMLEPLLRCNLACRGCGKIRQPREVLQRELTPGQCVAAADECHAPVVSIAGGEPLLHPEIDEIAAGLVGHRKFVYLCTNGLKLEESLEKFRPSKYLSFSVHLDGPREEHDRSVAREGVYGTAIRAIRRAVESGFRVTTNTTVYRWSRVDRLQMLFDELTDLKVEGIMLSAAFAYETAVDHESFPVFEQSREFFRELLAPSKSRGWPVNQSPLYLEFLQGRWDLDCTPWGTATYGVLGWQRPRYVLDEGYCGSFSELVETTDWTRYGHKSGNPKCRHCMIHSGFEPSAVASTLGTWKGFLATVRLARPGRPAANGRHAGPPSGEGAGSSELAAEERELHDTSADRSQ